MENETNKFRIITLGCRTNQYESQAYQNQLLRMGYQEAKEGEKADICIVNTCTVTESADSSSRHAIRQLARENQETQLLVTGCFAERQPEAIQKIDGVTHVIPNREKEQLLARLFPKENLPEFSITQFDSHTRAFIKVQDGCNSFCTYCIIPYVRGRSRSRSVEEILEEAKALISNGYKEIVLTGINIGDFDGKVAKGENPVRLSELVRMVDQLPGLERLRLSSIDPDEVDDELSDAILNGKHTCHSMHIVLQSGSNVILKRMNRKYTRQIFLDTVDKLKAAHSDFTFTTDIIVGFPGETDLDFQDTIEVMRYVKFAKVHMFPYSDRPRTRSNLMPNKVSPEMIRVRKQEILRVAEQTAYKLREGYLNRRMKILTESIDEARPGEIHGHTENFLSVWIQGEGIQSNKIVEVELVANTPAGLIGKPCPNPFKLYQP
ncbi:tRNA (N(6)-L-threonylcarbamoyladenosine(37)-C(2))-methylthiotransferase MtaB [Candidatus Protochlamydia sp. R18]|uniref:tRNA (N(6)-L-threonylcarbamoyladenosine(37)-C(2))- methylthiotransferase MtaB n=1 Tax=Candidatus Protochlamydia sp. R18 TaxID=1353977 RepID=UPI0005A7AAEA|nr:tRNA (N(6)-L-threonylcarbamoyladenosine(37)-C(2))-methylthiotransferase MtaB [Candidatus Protochlamydia sp. R18]